MNPSIDPIQQLRDAFDAVEPCEAQRDRWVERTRVSIEARDERRAMLAAIDREPVPWRLIGGLGVAAMITIAVLFAQPVERLESVVGAQAARHDMNARFASMTETASQPTSPVRQPQMEMHIPATGVNLAAPINMLRDAVMFVLPDVDERT